MTQQSNEAARIARAVIHDTNFLLDREEFLRFLDRWKKIADKWADDILHNNEMSEQDRHDLRLRRLGVLEVLQSPYQDRDAQRSVLASMGQKSDVLNDG